MKAYRLLFILVEWEKGAFFPKKKCDNHENQVKKIKLIAKNAFDLISHIVCKFQKD